MAEGEGSKGGHVIGHYSSGRAIYDSDREDNSHGGIKTAAIVGTGAGAAYHLNKEREASAIEGRAPNKRNLRTFRKSLKPGDILVAGSSAKNASGFEYGDTIDALPKALQKPAKKLGKILGFKKRDLLLSNATSLPLFGAGSKYHGAIYLGKGKVSHMTTDAGAQVENLSDVVEKSNVTAFRFKGAAPKEVNEAIRYATRAAKKNVPYQQFSEFSQNAIANYIFPISKTTSKKNIFKPLVCHTLPIRAYSKRKFPLGEHTFAGDFKKVEGLTAVATRNVVKAKGTSIKALIGIGGRGLKWGAAAAGIAYLANRFGGKKDDQE